ncbi:YadA-like family protein [Acinetobacter pittii]|uniref:YadA-like family protein n=1 Tax=Acinetobacter pittii TaxID=48296 RepID=UPI003A8BEF87
MNHIYRLLWNSSLGAWIAVSEHAKSSGKKSSKKISASVCTLIVGGSLFSFNVNAYSVAGADVCADTNNKIGIGQDAQACLTNTIAIGTSAKSFLTDAIAIGHNSVSEGVNNISLGSGAQTGNTVSTVPDAIPLAGGSQIAIGTNAKTDTAGSVAIGYNAATGVSQNFGIALGGYAQALGNSSIAVGRRAQSTGFNSTAVGARQTIASAGGATALGSHTIASGFESVAVGAGRGNDASTTSTLASGRQAVSVGANSKATNTSATAVGTNAIASGENGIAIGTGAQANAKDTISIGTGNIVSGQGSGAIGDPTTVTGTGTYSIGNNNGTIAANESGVFGNNNNINGNLSGVRVIGNTNTVSNDNVMVVGNENTATSANAAVLGNYNTVSEEGGVGIGRNNIVSGTRAISMGTNSEATGEQSISIGHLTKATAQGATALGWGADASGLHSTSIGEGSTASGAISSAIGSYATASGTLSLALGSALANKDNSVAIGTLSDTNTNATQQSSATLNGLTYGDFAGQVTDTGMQVSIGAVGRERQIKNVGSGEISSTSTDGINGSQLYATNEILGNVSNSIQTTLGGNATLNPDGSIAMTDIGGTGQNTIHNAILASQEEVAAGTNVASVDKTTGTNGQDIYTVNAKGTTASAGSSAVTVTAGTPDANNVTDYAVDLSQASKDSLAKADTALQSVVTQIDGVDVKTVDQNDNKVNFVSGDNVALTANADGSITVGTAADVTFNSVNTTNLTSTGTTQLGDSFTVNSGGSYYTGPITEGDHITNKTYVDQATASAKTEVAAGTNVASVDKTTGTNGQDIYTVNAKGTTASAGSSAVTVTAGTPDANNVTDYAVDLSQASKDSLAKADTALQSVVTQIDGVDVKTVDQNDNKVNFVSGDNVALTANADGSITVGTAADVTFNSVNTTNLTSTGTTQLGDSFTVNSGGSYYTGPITEGDHITNKTYVDQATASAKTEVQQGKNITVTSSTGKDGQTVYKVATADEVDFNKVTVGDTTISKDGIAVANGPSITKDGISGGGKKVTDVADGMISVDSKDSINGSQLHAIGNNVTQLFGGNATYVNNQITWNNIGGTGQNTVDDAIKHVNNQVINANQGWNVSTDSGSNATSTVKPGQTVNINGNSDSGVLVTNSGNDIKVSLSDQIKIGSGDNAVSINGNAGTIQAGNVLIDGSKGNISAGKVSINGEAGTVNGLTNTTWNSNNIVSGQAATEDQLQQVAQNASAAATAAKTTVSAGENITISNSKNSDGSTNYQVATSKDVKFNTVNAGSVTTDKISVGNASIDKAGINAGGNKVSNVANGTVSSTSKDAINGSQLHTSNTTIYNYLGGGANYETNTGPTYNVGGGSYNNVGDALNSLDQKVTNVSNQLEQAFYSTNQRIDDVENRANAGNAQALATAGLPQAYIPGKNMMAISGGTYRGETGYAIGMSSISDNGKWVFKVSGSGNSRGDFGGTVGAGIQW